MCDRIELGLVAWQHLHERSVDSRPDWVDDILFCCRNVKHPELVEGLFEKWKRVVDTRLPFGILWRSRVALGVLDEAEEIHGRGGDKTSASKGCSSAPRLGQSLVRRLLRQLVERESRSLQPKLSEAECFPPCLFCTGHLSPCCRKTRGWGFADI
jgi:hypothetical protein